MDTVRFQGDLPALRRPVLIAAFEGWNDAGESASSALHTIRRGLRAQTFAIIEPEEFYDFQVARPTVRFTDDGGREIQWPRTRFSWASLPGRDHHVVLLDAIEPNLRWRTYTDAVVGLADQLGVELAITVGALQVDVPHTRAVPLTASTADADLAAQLKLSHSTYEGPTGITGVLHHAFATASVPAVSLWAGVPHYLAGGPYAAGALALVERIGLLLGVDLPAAELPRVAAEQADDIAAMLAQDDDLADYVSELEERAAIPSNWLGDHDLPAPPASGEELAAELERYLRDRGDS